MYAYSSILLTVLFYFKKYYKKQSQPAQRKFVGNINSQAADIVRKIQSEKVAEVNARYIYIYTPYVVCKFNVNIRIHLLIYLIIYVC